MTMHTLNIYRYLHDNLPPLFPEELAEEIKNSIERFEEQDNIELEELERQMVQHGFIVWPYYQAHKEFLERAIDEMGDHFLEPYMNEGLQNKYSEFKGYGGNWRELYSGRAADFFEDHERVELTKALIEAKKKLKEYIKRDVHGLSKDKYLSRVEKYDSILSDIKKELQQLRELSSQEDHIELTKQIDARIENIEHSFAHLGQELQYHEIFNAVEFFRGRKEELSRLRGIDVPKFIDFYNENYSE